MSKFVLCPSNEGYEAGLVRGKIYRALPDPEVAKHDLLRVVDKDLSEPDGYLYPAVMSAPVGASGKAEEELQD